MHRRVHGSTLLAVIALAGALNACQCGTEQPCTSASDCPAGEDCDPATGRCGSTAATDGGTDAGTGHADAGRPDAASSSGGGDGGTACTPACAQDTVCRLGSCIPPPPGCTVDEECQDDARCLAGECIPFGVGGETNPACTVLVPLGVFTPSIQCEWQPPSSGTPCENPCAATDVCALDETFQGPHCSNAVTSAHDGGACANPCTAPREVCMLDDTGALSCQDPFRQLLSSVMVVDFDFDNDPATLRPSLVFSSYGYRDGSVTSGSKHGVLRIVDGATCQTQYTLDGTDPQTGLPLRVAGSSSVALGDIDGDGRAEIVAHAQGGGVWAFRFDVANDRFAVLWRGRDSAGINTLAGALSRWTGPAIHDLDDDGVPEILMEGAIFDASGLLLGDSQFNAVRAVGTGAFPVAADIDLDGRPELVTGDQQYDFTGNDWTPHALTPTPMGADGLVAVGDFGAFDVSGAADPGYPEIVVVGARVRVRTLDGIDVFPPTPVPPAAVIRANGSLENGTGGYGGAPTIGDFDGDGRAEFAEAGGRAYTVFDFDCLGSNTECTSNDPCPAGEACPLPGRCSKSSARCTTHADCSAGEDCFVMYGLGGHCSVTTATACTVLTDCPEGELCMPDGLPPRRCAPMQCEGHGILWTQVSQDLSSNRTGSSIFDFEGDGQVEAVYADECYTRVYDGRSGNVLFSQMHTSCTWYENPVVADVDGDLRTEIVIGSNENCGTASNCALNAFTDLGADGVPSDDDVKVDPIFAGLRCETEADCPGTTPLCRDGLCRCTSDADCGGGDFVCAAPISGSTVNLAKVCRAVFTTEALDGRPGLTGVRVYRDQADRWVGSRPVWNQHAYAITHVGDRGEIPRSSEVARNWATEGLNNFRQNVQGGLDATTSPDVTSGAGTVGTCEQGSAGFVVPLSSRICNRGTAPVGGGIAVTFYRDAVATGNALCTARTSGQLDPGECEVVSCQWDGAPSLQSVGIFVRADDDGTGTGERAECLEGNNGARVGVVECRMEG